MLTTSNKPLTNQLLSCRNQIPEQQWDTIGVKIAFNVPQPPDVVDFPTPGGTMNLEATVPCRMLNADLSSWPEPADPHFLQRVQIKVNIKELELHGTMLPVKYQPDKEDVMEVGKQ